MIEKRDDGTYSFLSDTSIMVTGDADLTLQLADGSRVVLKNFEDGHLGIHLNTTGGNSETNRTIVGDLAPMDFDSALAGVQTRIDDLNNIIVDPTKPEPNRIDLPVRLHRQRFDQRLWGLRLHRGISRG